MLKSPPQRKPKEEARIIFSRQRRGQPLSSDAAIGYFGGSTASQNFTI